MRFRAEVTAREQLYNALECNVNGCKYDYVYTPSRLLNRDTPDKGRVVAVPPVFIGGAQAEITAELKRLNSYGFTRALAHTIGHIPIVENAGMSVCGGFRLNITNSRALAEYTRLGLCDAVVSIELGLHRFASLKREIPTGIIAYGKLPLMIFRRCPVSKRVPVCRDRAGNGGVAGEKRGCCLTDRKGKRLPLVCREGEAELLNPVPLILSDKISDKARDADDFAVLRFFDENPAEILEMYLNGVIPVGNFTRGL